ncbi:FadR/GntR family transcriptional regulator [Kribbia dieselivorans]|uniref:FadR/GntR family transcriptional regulator n=1 Tax=Kribbia dieselivorans TaxID=331526 RepID=UPI000839A8AD|nr:FCD domain-containing protein [Kribbia dieselivorans]
MNAGPAPTAEGAPAARPFDLQPVEVQSPAEVFADVLRAKIFSGELPPGSSLPPERVLVEQSRLGRATVRESLQMLKQQGLITTRVGRGGGSIVSRPSSEDLISALDVYAHSNGFGPEDPAFVETREIIEPWCAALAARRRSEADLAEMERWHQRTIDVLRDQGEYLRASQAWHLAVNSASGNSLVAALMHIGRDTQLRVADLRRYSTLAARKRSIEEHEAILEAIRAQRPTTAFELMAGHCAGQQNRPLLDRLDDEVATVSPDSE